jgi:uracil phosphoribosyltransferase
MHTEIRHPLLQHKLTRLRDRSTGAKEFRELTSEIGMLLAYEALRDVGTETCELETPMCRTTGVQLRNDLVLIPILRAGVGMLDGILGLVPIARVGFIGMYRDPETKSPVEYYAKLPDNLRDPIALIADPMLATGGSVAAAATMLKARGVERIVIVAVIAAPEGLDVVETAHPDVPIFVASVDSHLDDHKYIIPGLGDAGDRLYGTH